MKHLKNFIIGFFLIGLVSCQEAQDEGEMQNSKPQDEITKKVEEDVIAPDNEKTAEEILAEEIFIFNEIYKKEVNVEVDASLLETEAPESSEVVEIPEQELIEALQKASSEESPEEEVANLEDEALEAPVSSEASEIEAEELEPVAELSSPETSEIEVEELEPLVETSSPEEDEPAPTPQITATCHGAQFDVYVPGIKDGHLCEIHVGGTDRWRAIWNKDFCKNELKVIFADRGCEVTF